MSQNVFEINKIINNANLLETPFYLKSVERLSNRSFKQFMFGKPKIENKPSIPSKNTQVGKYLV